MKYTEPRPYADPNVAARKLIEIANSVEAVQDGRIHIEKSTDRSFSNSRDRQRNGAGLKLAIARDCCCCMRAGLTLSSLRRERSCLHERGRQAEATLLRFRFNTFAIPNNGKL